MLLRLKSLAVLCLLVISCLTIVDARRRQRIDSPSEKPIDAPVEESVATVTVAEVTAEKLEAPAPTTTATVDPSTEADIAEEVTSGENNSSEESLFEDCDVDNISFELVTG